MSYLTVDEFYKQYPNMQFYKLLNADEKQHHFKTGLNVDILSFNPNGTCCEGGLYFISNESVYYEENDIEQPFWIRKVTFTDDASDAKIYVENDRCGIKFKCDKFILGERQFYEGPSMFKQPYEFIFKVNRDALCYIDEHEQTEEMCKYAIRMNPYAIRFIAKRFQTNEMYKYFIQKHFEDGLQFIPKLSQTEELCKIAVNLSGENLRYVEKQFQTEEICKLAIQRNPYALEYVKVQTEELCKMAVKKCGLTLQFVNKQFITEELCKLAVQINGLALEYVPGDKKTDEICKLAVQQNNDARKYVKNAYWFKSLFI